MSKRGPLSDAEVIAALNDLIQLDHDAIEGYTIAINTIRNHGHREALVAFRHDHARHVEALGALVRERGGKPARVSHLGGPLGPAVKSLGAAKAGDAAVLLAFRAVERETRRRYLSSVSDQYPDDVRPLLLRHASDEEIHFQWIESSIEGLGLERDLKDSSLRSPSSLHRYDPELNEPPA